MQFRLFPKGMVDVLKRIWRLVSRPGRLKEELSVHLDYLSFKQKYSFLSRGADRADPAKKVLMVSLTDRVAYVKSEAILLKSLQLKGYTPVILTYRSCKRALRYFRVFGYDQFLYFDDFLNKSSDEADTTIVNSLLADNPSFRSILDFTAGGVEIGKNVLSTVVRNLHHGSVAFGEPYVMGIIRQAFVSALQAARAAEALFEAVDPHTVIFFEKGYSPGGEIFGSALKRGFNIIQYLNSHRLDALVMKRYTEANKDIHTFSLSLKSWERVCNMPWSERQEEEFLEEIRQSYAEGTWFNRKLLMEGKKMKTAEEVRRELRLDPQKKVAVIFSHVLWDATFFYGTNLFDDYEQWLIDTVKVACDNPHVNWVIKLHPDYVWKMKEVGKDAEPTDIIALEANIGRLPDHVKVVAPDTDISTYSFFAITDYCITVRGTIGIEAPCFGIPVFTAGTGRYSGLGFTNDSESREEYLEKLRHIQDFPALMPEEKTLACKHAYALFKLRPFYFHTFEMVQTSLKKLGQALSHNVLIHAQSLSDVQHASDLRAFSDWAVDSREEDYLSL